MFEGMTLTPVVHPVLWLVESSGLCDRGHTVGRLHQEGQAHMEYMA